MLCFFLKCNLSLFVTLDKIGGIYDANNDSIYKTLYYFYTKKNDNIVSTFFPKTYMDF